MRIDDDAVVAWICRIRQARMSGWLSGGGFSGKTSIAAPASFPERIAAGIAVASTVAPPVNSTFTRYETVRHQTEGARDESTMCLVWE